MVTRIWRTVMVIGIVLNAAGCLMLKPTATVAAQADQSVGAILSTSAPEREAAPSPLEAPVVATWAERGIRFEGPWREAEIDLVTGVLARFADRLGEERLLDLKHKAVTVGTEGRTSTLTFIRDPSEDVVMAYYACNYGRVRIYDNLFDQAYVDEHYPWRFEDALGEAPSGPISDQTFIIGHELGHMIVHGLHAEYAASQKPPTYLEDLYGDTLDIDHWAHPIHGTTESMASEIALWVFEVARPESVETFRDAYLIPALLGPASAGSRSRRIG